MPTTAAPPATSTEKLPLLEEDAPEETIRFEDMSIAQMAVVGRRASREAQAELHRRGISYVIGRNDSLIEVLPSGEEVPYIPSR